MSNSQNVINFTKRRKENLTKLFNGKCCICGFNDYVEALDFHHVNPEEKNFPLQSGVMKSLEKQIEEARKCILVCANCHRGIHAGKIKISNDYKKFFNEEVADYLLKENEEIKHGKKHYCIDCGVLLATTQATRCPDCASKAQRIAVRPNREELKNLIRLKPFTQIAKDFGVSDNTIRKWCDSYNLPRKKTEIVKYTDTEWEQI